MSTNLDLISRHHRLNRLAEINMAKRYLEVGVFGGKTFRQINIQYKVGVDPEYQFDTSPFQSDTIQLLEMTSDDFFSRHANNYEPFDLIYLDGLHEFEQTFRDFCASVSCAHEKTIWVIDDTCPRSYAQSHRSQEVCQQIKQQTKEDDELWMGDVYKTVAAIHDFFPQYSFGTFRDHGQTVVWRKWREDFMPRWNSLEAISRLDYADFLALRKDILKPTPYEALFQKVSDDLLPADR